MEDTYRKPIFTESDWIDQITKMEKRALAAEHSVKVLTKALEDARRAPEIETIWDRDARAAMIGLCTARTLNMREVADWAEFYADELAKVRKKRLDTR
jgi:hypothetical protein